MATGVPEAEGAAAEKATPPAREAGDAERWRAAEGTPEGTVEAASFVDSGMLLERVARCEGALVGWCTEDVDKSEQMRAGVSTDPASLSPKAESWLESRQAAAGGCRDRRELKRGRANVPPCSASAFCSSSSKCASIRAVVTGE